MHRIHEQLLGCEPLRLCIWLPHLTASFFSKTAYLLISPEPPQINAAVLSFGIKLRASDNVVVKSVFTATDITFKETL